MLGTPRDTKMNKTCNLEDIRQIHENLKQQLSKEGQIKITQGTLTKHGYFFSALVSVILILLLQNKKLGKGSEK